MHLPHLPGPVLPCHCPGHPDKVVGRGQPRKHQVTRARQVHPHAPQLMRGSSCFHIQLAPPQHSGLILGLRMLPVLLAPTVLALAWASVLALAGAPVLAGASVLALAWASVLAWPRASQCLCSGRQGRCWRPVRRFTPPRHALGSGARPRRGGRRFEWAEAPFLLKTIPGPQCSRMVLTTSREKQCYRPWLTVPRGSDPSLSPTSSMLRRARTHGVMMRVACMRSGKAKVGNMVTWRSTDARTACRHGPGRGAR